MRNFFKIAGLLALTGFISSCNDKETTANYQIIPLPQKITTAQSQPFTLNGSVKIIYLEGNEEVQRNAQFLANYLKKTTDKDYAVGAGTEGKGAILLKLGTEPENPEAYQLSVNADGVTIAAPTEAGVFYGIQTLRRSIPVAIGTTPSSSAVEINDYPRFSYRGAHFDVGRHFFTVDEVKTYIDMMALHNMNRLHWHLTEDQGWRLETKKYPKLTEIGSKRSETVIEHNSGEYDGKPYGGFYTQEEAKGIVAYATDRYIIIIPEIDLPGHVQGALAAHPHLGCTGGPYEVWKIWGVSDQILCASNDSVLTFIGDVLTEVMEIFLSEYIHVGGNECPKTKWAKCPKCQARIKALGIKSDAKHSKEGCLQSSAINHAEKFLNEHGRQIIGWDEILEGGLAPNATVMSWCGEGGGIEAAKQKHDVIMTLNTYLYLDCYQTKDIENEPLAIGGYMSLERVYGYEPMPSLLAPDEQKHTIGVQANLWAEYIPIFAQTQYMALLRWTTLSEIQWSNPKKKNYDNFLSRLPQLISIYEAEGYDYAKHVFDVRSEFVANLATGAVDVVMTTIDGAPIYYTLDGTEPTAVSPIYDSILTAKESCTLKAVVVRSTGDDKVLTEKIALSKSTSKPIKANQPVNKQYEFGGVSTSVDGLKGNGNYKTGRWIAFYRNDMDATIDLQQPTEISSVAITTCVKKGDWVFGACSFSIEVPDDDKTFTKVASEAYPEMKETDRNGLYEHQLIFDPVKTRYVKVVAISEHSIPAWHGGKGSPGSLFVGEIMLNWKNRNDRN